MNFCSSSGPGDTGSAPCSVNRLRTAGSFTASSSALYSLSTTGFGIPAGPSNASQP